MGLIDDILEAYPDEHERERQENAGERPRELAPVRTKHSKKDFDQATRVKALQYRLAGMTYQSIGTQLRCTASEARAIIQYALKNGESESIEDMREIENHRLDAMQRAIWPRVLEGNLDAFDRALKLAQTRARLNGLEAPKKIDLALSVRQEMEQALGHLEALVEGDIVDAEEVNDDDESTGGDA